MSKDWVKDIHEMHDKYRVHEFMKVCMENEEYGKLKDFLKFRVGCLSEELQETVDAVNDKNPEEIVDGLIDLCVFAIGTLDLFGIDGHKAWDSVLQANMSKEVGLKEGRANPFGLPDLMKPPGWKAPSHEGNHGILHDIQ